MIYGRAWATGVPGLGLGKFGINSLFGVIHVGLGTTSSQTPNSQLEK